jgi:hypothetical protein
MDAGDVLALTIVFGAIGGGVWYFLIRPKKAGAEGMEISSFGLEKDGRAGLIEQAEAIVRAGFAQRGALAVSANPGDPLSGTIGYKNNNLSPGASVRVGYVLGSYDAASQKFSASGFEKDGEVYIWGSAILDSIPAKGTTVSRNVATYTLTPPESTTFDILVFLAIGALQSADADYGAGSRTVGLKWSDFQALTILANKAYQEQLSVSPAGPPPAVEIINFQLAKI